jgi:hypothetical protein
VRDFSKYAYDNAEGIAAAAHEETGLGVYEDKIAKVKARVIWNNLKGKKSRGIIGEDDEVEHLYGQVLEPFAAYQENDREITAAVTH